MCHTCNDFHNVKDDNFSSKIKYSRVRNLIIIFHGYDNGDGFDFGHTPVGEKNYIEENDIGSLAIYHTNCVIEHVDIQACYSYRDYDGDRTTVATAIATSKKYTMFMLQMVHFITITQRIIILQKAMDVAYLGCIKMPTGKYRLKT